MDHMKKRMEDRAMDALSKPDPSIEDVRDVLKLIIEKMWSEERLAEYVRRVHDSMCANCQRVKGEGGKMSGRLIALVGSLVAAVCGLTGAVVKLAMR